MVATAQDARLLNRHKGIVGQNDANRRQLNCGMSRTPHIIFRADASRAIGGGHVMRCLTLADALLASGCRISFVTRPETLAVVPRIEASPYGVMALAGTESEIRAAALDRRLNADWLVIDHYGLEAADETDWRAAAPRIMVLDDLANRPHDCDLLVDSSFGRTKSAYRRLLASPVPILAGPDFALIRPAFREKRKEVLERRKAPPAGLPRLFVSLGLTDVGGITATVIEKLLAARINAVIDCLVPVWAPSAGPLQALASRHPNLKVHKGIKDPAPLMAEATLAIGGGGQTSFERCVLGLPSLVMILADNQERATRILAESGAAIIGERDSLAEQVRELLDAPERLHAMSAMAASLVDGEGTRRVLKPLLTPRVTFRKADARDGELVLSWRNDPETRRQSRETAQISATAHAAWYAARLADPDTLLLIVEADAKPVGAVRFERKNPALAQVSANLAPEVRGQGMAVPMLSGAMMQANRSGFCRKVEVEVREENIASLRLVEACNFRRIGASSGWEAFELDLDPLPELAWRNAGLADG